MVRARRLATGVLIALSLSATFAVTRGSQLALAIEGMRHDVVTKGSPELENRNGVSWYRGAPLTGTVVEREGPRTISHTPYVAGREHGVVEAWYPRGALRTQRLYRFGLREGTHRGFYENGQLQFVSSYRNDLLEGDATVYFEDGRIAELRHYLAGREDGRQRVYDRVGKLIANYVFKDGRRYGIVGRFDCISMVTR
jgi:antitoxin component YwqK of YwqJK toxin-antitoxin module